VRRSLLIAALALLVTSVAAQASSPEIHGASVKQRHALDQVLAGLPGTAIDAIGLQTATGTKGVSPRGTILLTVRAGGGDPLRNLWEEWMLGAAFRDASAAAHLTPVTAVATDVDTRRVPKPSAAAPPPAGPDAQAKLERQVRAAVAASGATLKSITLLAPRGLAVAARLQTSDPGGFLENQALPLVNRMNAIHPVGWYLELDDHKGKAWVGEVSAPAGYEGEWFRSDLQGCDPFGHQQPAGYTPAACPAL
jgi:hypothetical protein